jgi:hypothetical protein
MESDMATIELPPKPLTLKAQVQLYFETNPDEELTHAILRTKFSMSKWTAVWILRELKDEGILESAHVIRLRVKGIAR